MVESEGPGKYKEEEVGEKTGIFREMKKIGVEGDATYDKERSGEGQRGS